MAKLTSSSFTISASLKQGWEIFKANWPFLLGVSLVMFAIQFVGGFLTGRLEEEGMSGLASLLQLVFFGVNLIVGMGWIHIMLKLVRSQTAVVGDLFAKSALFIKYLIGVVLYGLLVLVGLILLVIPGIYFAIKYAFVQYLIIDKDAGPIEAFKTSAKMTKGIKWELLGFHVVVLVINILGALALGIGLLITTPVTALAYVTLYDQLLSRAE